MVLAWLAALATLCAAGAALLRRPFRAHRNVF